MIGLIKMLKIILRYDRTQICSKYEEAKKK